MKTNLVLLILLLATGHIVPALGQAPAAKKASPPAAAALAEANKLVADVYKKDYESAKSPQQKRALATKLLGVAQGTKGEPVNRYALLVAARKLAVSAGDLGLIIRTVDALGDDFDVDRASVVADALKEVAKLPKSPEQHFLILRWVEHTLAVAARADSYAAAPKLADFGLQAAKGIKDRELLEQWTRRVKEIKAEAEAFVAAGKAKAILESRPTDAAANASLGKFRALVQRDWKRGLAHLAQGDDKDLASLAQRELKLPADAADRVALADAWYAWANAQTPPNSSALVRAGYWYRRALPELTGLEKARLTKRSAEIDALVSPFRDGRWVELLDEVDVGRDRVMGSWERRGLAIETGAARDIHLLAIPVEIDGPFEVCVRVTNFTKELGIFCPDPEHPFEMAINCWSGEKSGIHTIDRVGGDANASCVKGFPTDPSQMVAVTVRAERADGLAAIEAQINGRKYIAWRGPEGSLASEYPDHRQRLMITSNYVPLTVLSVQLRMLSGTAHVVEP